MDIVTFETAKRLKEAGFPQPEFATGQMWYNQYGAITFLSKKEVAEEGTHVYFFCISVVSGRTDRIVPIHDGAFFAPSATDILREMQKCTRKWFSWILTPPYKTATTWRCYGFEKEEGADFYVEHENPSEACAINWLKIFGK
jgi:hypothetical protein